MGSIHGDINSLVATQQPGVQLVDVTTKIRTRKGDLHFAHEQVVYNTAADGEASSPGSLEITGGTGPTPGPPATCRAQATPPATG